LVETNPIRSKRFNLGILVHYLPVIIVTGFWCYMQLQLGLEIHDYIMMNITFAALIVILSSFVLKDGNENLGYLGLVIGFSVYFGSIIVHSSLPLNLLLQIEIEQILNLINTLGAAISLFAAVSLGLSLSNTRINPERRDVRYGALIISGITMVAWLVIATIPVLEIESLIVTVPGVELLFFVILILTSSIFIPRRQFITLFYFTLGLALTMGGLLILTRPSSLDSVLLGYYLRIFGTIFMFFFALPFGASTISYKSHPESGFYIATTIWALLEILLASHMYPFSPIRVFAIAAIILLSFRTLKSDQPILLVFGALISAALAVFGISVFLGAQFSSLSMTFTYAGLGLTVVSTSLLIFTVLSLGESIRIRLKDNQMLVRGLGLTLILLGIIVGLSALSIAILFVFQLDILFLILIGLGSMLLVVKPSRAVYIAFVFGGLAAASVVFTEFLYSIQVWYYSSFALMIFSCIQLYRVESMKEDSVITG